MNAHGGRLSGLTSDLWQKWLATRDLWRDAKANEFERTYLAELRPAVDKTLDVMEQLDKLLTKIKKDCE